MVQVRPIDKIAAGNHLTLLLLELLQFRPLVARVVHLGNHQIQSRAVVAVEHTLVQAVLLRVLIPIVVALDYQGVFFVLAAVVAQLLPVQVALHLATAVQV